MGQASLPPSPPQPSINNNNTESPKRQQWENVQERRMKKREREKQQSNHTKVQQFIRNERRKAATRKGKSIKHMHNTRYKMMMTKCSSSFLGLCVFLIFIGSSSSFCFRLSLSSWGSSTFLKRYIGFYLFSLLSHTHAHTRARAQKGMLLSLYG